MGCGASAVRVANSAGLVGSAPNGNAKAPASPELPELPEPIADLEVQPRILQEAVNQLSSKAKFASSDKDDRAAVTEGSLRTYFLIHFCTCSGEIDVLSDGDYNVSIELEP